MLYAVNIDIIKKIMGEKKEKNWVYMQETGHYVFLIKNIFIYKINVICS